MFLIQRDALSWRIRSKLLICIVLLLLVPVSGGQASPKTVLIINEVGLAHPAAALVTQEILSRLSADRHFAIEFYVESLDSQFFSDSASEERAWTLMREEYADRKVDVIVAEGPASIRFLLGNPAFFPNTPVVFCGSPRLDVVDSTFSQRFTGSWYRPEMVENIQAALHLFPDTRHVFLVGGVSSFDNAVMQMVKADLDAHPTRVDYTYLTDLDMETLLQRVSTLPSHSAVFYVSLFRDSKGTQYVNATGALPLVSERANAPVFGLSDTYLGNGALGGFVISFAEQGHAASDRVLQILQGLKPSEIPIVTLPNRYMFDWKQMRRWEVTTGKLPPGSTIVNRPPTLWERSKWVIVTSICVVFGLSVVIAYLVLKQRQLREARKEQTRLSGVLINAQDEERRRIAAELHDDFSQRLALLSMELGEAADCVTSTPDEAVRQLQKAIEDTGDMGKDIHTLSRRLHSSTLAKLGLVAGINDLCRDFGRLQGIQVDFTHENVPRVLPPDIALCLFRIVQEALHNVKKHSRSTTAHVSLGFSDNVLHLLISDDGHGFNPRQNSDDHGVGLWSMEQRALLINGRFEIRSNPGQGTRIDVWTPSLSPSVAKKHAEAGN